MARMSRLAIFGGKPVRTEPYPPHNTMIGEEEEREVLEVLRSGNLSGFSATSGERFLGGPKVRALEAAFAEKFGVKYAVATNSATSALHCAIAALGIGPGDEVITSPFTMSATAAAIVSNGATPVFCDIESVTYGLNWFLLPDKITGRTKAILAINLFGHPCNLVDISGYAGRNNVALVEDNAQSPGALLDGKLTGTFGQIGVQSMNYHKCIQAGEGGMALTDDVLLADWMRLARNHAEALGQDFIGGNHRMTELTAAVGLGQLGKLDKLTRIRQRLAEALTEAISGMLFLEPPAVADGCSHVYYLYPMKYRADILGISRSRFCAALRAEGISISEGYTAPTHLLPFYRKHYGTHEGQCPVAERMWKDVLLTTDICKYPNTERDVEQSAEAVEKIADNVGELRGHA